MFGTESRSAEDRRFRTFEKLLFEAIVGVPQAYLEMGRRFEEGRLRARGHDGADVNYPAALFWYHAAAKAGSPAAMAKLVQLRDDGVDIGTVSAPEAMHIVYGHQPRMLEPHYVAQKLHERADKIAALLQKELTIVFHEPMTRQEIVNLTEGVVFPPFVYERHAMRRLATAYQRSAAQTAKRLMPKRPYEEPARLHLSAHNENAQRQKAVRPFHLRLV